MLHFAIYFINNNNNINIIVIYLSLWNLSDYYGDSYRNSILRNYNSLKLKRERSDKSMSENPNKLTFVERCEFIVNKFSYG